MNCGIGKFESGICRDILKTFRGSDWAQLRGARNFGFATGRACSVCSWTYKSLYSQPFLKLPGVFYPTSTIFVSPRILTLSTFTLLTFTFLASYSDFLPRLLILFSGSDFSLLVRIFAARSFLRNVSSQSYRFLITISQKSNFKISYSF